MNIYKEFMVESCQIKKLDEYFHDIFGSKSDGYFIEVGAYDGISFSNTIPLVKNNWNGIYIEPVNEYFYKLKNNLDMYNKLILLNCAVSNEEGEKYINIMNTLKQPYQPKQPYQKTYNYQPKYVDPDKEQNTSLIDNLFLLFSEGNYLKIKNFK